MVGIGLIGTGYWGKNHARVYKELLSEGIIDYLILCDIDEKRVKELAGKDISFLTDYKKLLSDERIDAVDIVTPSKTHYLLGKEFLRAGKDVFVEKPMTMNTKTAEDFIKIAEKKDNILMVGHIFRYHPGIIEIKKRIERGDFGKIYYMNSSRMALGPPRRDMGVLFALGIHEVDMYCYLMEQKYPKKISASIGRFLQSNIEEIANITMEFENGTIGYAFESWMSPFFRKIREFKIIGSKMSAKIDYLKPQEIQFFEGNITSYKNNNEFIFDISDEGIMKINIIYKEPLKVELMHFVDCVKNRKEPISNMYAGKRAVEMIESCLYK